MKRNAANPMSFVSSLPNAGQLLRAPRSRSNGESAKSAPRAFRRQRRPEERVQALGATMDLVKPPEVFNFVAAKIAAGETTIIANHNMHSLYLLPRSPGMQEFYRRADLIEVDSIPVLAWARLVGRPSRTFHRCTYLDWRDEFWAQATAKQWRVFFVGGAPGVAEKARETILAQWPDVTIEVQHGFFDAAPGTADNEAILEKINAFKPDVLFVGMGMPRQELWVTQNCDRVHPCAIFTVGGAFDYEAGAQAMAPRWLGRLGAEWAFRLAANPRRMFRRYCVEPWALIGPAIGDVVQAVKARRMRGARRPSSSARPLSGR